VRSIAALSLFLSRGSVLAVSRLFSSRLASEGPFDQMKEQRAYYLPTVCSNRLGLTP